MSKKLKLTAVVFPVSILLLVGASHFLTKRESREVKNSNWSMQGEWIAFSCPVGYESHLYLVRPDGSELTRLTTDEIVTESLSWSPDGEEVVLEKYMAGLYRLRRGSDELIPLNVSDDQQDKDEIYPEWSPDGQWIAFVSWPRGEGSSLLRVNVENGKQETLVRGIERGPVAWSPDGRWIAYKSAEEIRKVRVNSGETQTIVRDRYAKSPAWSPDGKRIVFSDGSNVYIVNEDGNQKTWLTDLASRSSDPAWSPDGQWIVFTSYVERLGEELFKIRTDGSDIQQITEMHCAALYPDWIRMPGS
jgi:Tol biopolymer transport system component